jgi:hypothetical protein
MGAYGMMYAHFTTDERLRLIVLAQARADVTEVDRLWASCPQMDLVGRDPQFCRRVHRTRDAVASVISDWLEVSYYVTCGFLLETTLRLESECKSRKLKIEGASEDEVAKLQADYAALAVETTANWKAYSAMWKGIESGVARWCSEVEITRDQLLAIGGWLPAAIEHAGGQLDPDSRISRACTEGTYRRLRRAWRDEHSE